MHGMALPGSEAEVGRSGGLAAHSHLHLDRSGLADNPLGCAPPRAVRTDDSIEPDLCAGGRAGEYQAAVLARSGAGLSRDRLACGWGGLRGRALFRKTDGLGSFGWLCFFGRFLGDRGLLSWLCFLFGS